MNLDRGYDAGTITLFTNLLICFILLLTKKSCIQGRNNFSPNNDIVTLGATFLKKATTKFPFQVEGISMEAKQFIFEIKL